MPEQLQYDKWYINVIHQPRQDRNPLLGTAINSALLSLGSWARVAITTRMTPGVNARPQRRMGTFLVHWNLTSDTRILVYSEQEIRVWAWNNAQHLGGVCFSPSQHSISEVERDTHLWVVWPACHWLLDTSSKARSEFKKGYVKSH